MKKISITAEGVTKEFNRRTIFRDISFSLSTPSSLAVTGKNGSGKSTLSKIIAGLMTPTKGSVLYSVNDKPSGSEDLKHNIGFVSPYLNLYDEFTALENLRLLSRIRSADWYNDVELKEVLEPAGLWKRRNDFIGTYSSGMKQRMKYAFALLHRPEILILDEPTSNLDAEGVEFVKQIVARQKEAGILIVATNDKEEASWCMMEISINSPFS
jgi:heme exporter protein A